MKKISLSFLTASILFATPTIDLIIEKHNLCIKIEKQLKRIVELSLRDLQGDKITILDYIKWVNKLYNEKLKKLNLEYEYKVKDNPTIKGPVDFEESINYASSFLNLNIQRVSYLEKPLLSIKSIDKKDFEVLYYEILKIYGEYQYALKLYKYHSKQKIPYKLPKNILDILNRLR